MTTYEPGTVAVATVRGASNVRVMRSSHYDNTPWVSERGIGAWGAWHRDADLTDIRLLVVLDPESLTSLSERGNADAAEELVSCLSNLANAERHTYRARVATRIAHQIEAQSKPRIPEPGMYAVVEAHSLGAKGDRLHWVRGLGGWTNLDATGEYLNWARWDDLVDPILVRDGVAS